MRALVPALAVAFLVALAAPMHAAHCTSSSTSPALLSSPPIEDVGQYHVVGPECGGPECWPISFLWIYEEANGISGLQRGDEMVDDTCHGSIAPDTIIY